MPDRDFSIPGGVPSGLTMGLFLKIALAYVAFGIVTVILLRTLAFWPEIKPWGSGESGDSGAGGD